VIICESGVYHGSLDDAARLVAFFAMQKDIFPAVNIPEVNLIWYYPGMSA
jgi:hypothetical protein